MMRWARAFLARRDDGPCLVCGEYAGDHTPGCVLAPRRMGLHPRGPWYTLQDGTWKKEER